MDQMQDPTPDAEPVSTTNSEGTNSEGTNSEGTISEGTISDAAADNSSGGAISADQARLVLRRVKDPDLNLNIVDLGLIYDVHVNGSNVQIDISLTSPGCPSGPEIMGEAEQQLRTIPGIGDVTMNLVWSPPWTPERIEPRVRAYMGF